MAHLHREFKKAELRRAWLRDPDLVLARYREAAARIGLPQHESNASLSEMIESIIDHESEDLTTARVLQSIAG